MGTGQQIDWGSLRERWRLVTAVRVPDEERASPKRLRGNLEFLWGGGSLLIVIGLVVALAGSGFEPNPFLVVGLLGWLIGVVVAIRLVTVVRRIRQVD